MWAELTYGNDWGRRYVLMGPRHMSKAGTWGVSHERTPVLDKAGDYRFLWPDGHEETIAVQMLPYSDTVGDMGHDYNVSGHEPFIARIEHGMEFLVPVRTLCGKGVKIWCSA